MAGSFRALFIMPNIDALIATGATLDTLVEVTADDPNNTWTFSSLNKVVPKIGSIIVLKDGSLARVRGKFFRFLLLEHLSFLDVSFSFRGCHFQSQASQYL